MLSKLNCGGQKEVQNISSEKVLQFKFDDDFDLSESCSGDEECSEGPSYHPQEFLGRVVTSAGVTSSDRGSSDECEDDEDIVSAFAMKIKNLEHIKKRIAS